MNVLLVIKKQMQYALNNYIIKMVTGFIRSYNPHQTIKNITYYKKIA